jgi:hypothetical protein
MRPASTGVKAGTWLASAVVLRDEEHGGKEDTKVISMGTPFANGFHPVKSIWGTPRFPG